jgi:polysaccharide biosynthesis protein PslH
MANLLYLVHRLPYPPNKGDKVRSCHLLKHLAARHRVYLGSFIDDPDDVQHLPLLRTLCADVFAPRLHTGRARAASLLGLASGEPLTLRYYRDAVLQRWVRQTVQREKIDAVVVFSSSMAQYAEGLGLPTLVDLVDVDSAKWTAYADAHRWPMSWLYRREGTRLLACERAVVAGAARSFLSTEKEAALFRSLAPGCAGQVEAMNNGVDAEYFAPDPARPSPFAAGEVPVVFTGAMDYWPNVDAVSWFAREMLPALRRARPTLRFHIVGRSPSAAVQALAGDAVHVSGTVPDVRPYLQHAAVVVAPLRLARGVQNKVLEAMAMGRPVVAARGCGEAIHATAGAELLLADDAAGHVDHVLALLADPQRAAQIGQAGRRRVVSDYAWAAQFAGFDRHLAGALRAAPLAAAPPSAEGRTEEIAA